MSGKYMTFQRFARETWTAHLYDSPLCDHSQLREGGAIWVLLHTQDAQAEGALELWVGNVGLLHSQACREPNKR